jgi:hypothetical protein
VASNKYPLHLVDRHFLGPPIVELRRPRAGMVRHLRRLLKRSPVLQIRGDARRPKRMIPDLGGDVGRARAAGSSRRRCPGDGIAGELAGRAVVALK